MFPGTLTGIFFLHLFLRILIWEFLVDIFRDSYRYVFEFLHWFLMWFLWRYSGVSSRIPSHGNPPGTSWTIPSWFSPESHRRFYQGDRWRTSSELFSKSTPELSPACSLLILHGFPVGFSFKVPSWRIPRITSYVSPEIPLGVSPGCSQRLLLKFCQGWLQDFLVDFSQDSFQEFCWNSCLILSAISPGLPSGILFGISLRISPGGFPDDSWFLPIIFTGFQITPWRCFFRQMFFLLDLACW